jgi:hypothetical protein
MRVQNGEVHHSGIGERNPEQEESAAHYQTRNVPEPSFPARPTVTPVLAEQTSGKSRRAEVCASIHGQNQLEVLTEKNEHLKGR